MTYGVSALCDAVKTKSRSIPKMTVTKAVIFKNRLSFRKGGFDIPVHLPDGERNEIKMDFDIANKIKSCFWQREPERAVETAEKHLGEIDFDDEDDVEKLIDIIIPSLGEEGGFEFLEYLISKGFDINYKLLKKECLILKCAERFIKPQEFQRLADLGADVYSETSDGDNVLLRCVEKNEELALYIAENFDLSQLDHSDKFGVTPLMHSVMTNNIRLTETLIKKGSDVNATGTGVVGGNGYWIKTGGLSPLALALRFGNEQAAKMLLEAGADEGLCDDEGYPPIFSLIYYPFRFLNDNHFNSPIFDKKRSIIPLMKKPDITDSRGYTVLMEALCSKDTSYIHTNAYTSLPVTLALIENGANVNAAANDGTTPLHLAVQTAEQATKALVKAGADINAQDNGGNTPLILACRYCGEKIVRWLLKSGADFNIKNNAGESPADICAARGFNDALELMI